MTVTFESDLDRVKTNQCTTYLGQRSFRSKVIVHKHTQTHTHTHTHTHRTNYYTWTTKVIRNKYLLVKYLRNTEAGQGRIRKG